MKNQNEIKYIDKVNKNDRRNLLCSKLDPLDMTYEEIVDSTKYEMWSNRDSAAKGMTPPEQNEYLHLRIELEKVLTERIPEEVEDIMVRSNHWGSGLEGADRKLSEASIDYAFSVIELMYREIYKDDPEFKPNLIEHTNEQLDKDLATM